MALLRREVFCATWSYPSRNPSPPSPRTSENQERSRFSGRGAFSTPRRTVVRRMRGVKPQRSCKALEGLILFLAWMLSAAGPALAVGWQRPADSSLLPADGTGSRVEAIRQGQSGSAEGPVAMPAVERQVRTAPPAGNLLALGSRQETPAGSQDCQGEVFLEPYEELLDAVPPESARISTGPCAGGRALRRQDPNIVVFEQIGAAIERRAGP